MANEYRNPRDFAFGTLSQAAAATDTVLNSASFAGMPTLSSGAQYVPMTLTNLATQIYETVWITGHASGSTQVTVARGKEGTTGQVWPLSSSWVVAPTTRDITGIGSSVSLPSDGHLGQRLALNDKGEVWEKTWSQGWMGTVKANTADIGRALDGTASAANGLVPILKAWTASGTTDASGWLTTAIPNGGFPTRIISVVMTRANAAGSFFSPSINSTNTTKTSLQIIAGNPAGSLTGAAIAVSIVAIGV